MGFQKRDQSYSVWPESGVLMDHGVVIEIQNFFSLFTQFVLHFVASSALWIHVTSFKMTGSFGALATLEPPLVPLHEPDDGDCRRRLPSWPAVKILSPL